MSDETAAGRAAELARQILIADTHIDVPYRLERQRDAGGPVDDVAGPTEGGDFDWPRARAGGLDLVFMSIYVPAEYQETGGARDFADALIDMVDELAERAPDRFARVDSAAAARDVFAAGDGRVALALGMENGAPLEGDLENVAYFRERGIRYITLTHSKNNAICDSSYDEERRWNGLSPFGREVVREMNRQGVIIDVSHVSDEAFAQVLELSEAPVLATHSSCRAFTPDWERNMSDDMIRALAENGGVIHVNFGSSFLTEEYLNYGNRYREERTRFLEEHGVERDSPEAEAWAEEFVREHPKPYATLDDVVAHIDHVVGLVGVDHVGFGSDFDGVGDSLPVGLKDVSQYPNLIEALLAAGYSEEDVEKMASGNLMRVWRAVEETAGRAAGARRAPGAPGGVPGTPGTGL